MNRNNQQSSNNQNGAAAQRSSQPRIEVEKMLRDIAFVLKMTEHVRAEMEADEEAHEAVLA
jgi:hypothetical protein